MRLKLHKPLCIFDLESTGTNITKDRIVEISILRMNVDGSKESKTWLVNPEMPIPESASKIHNIYDKDVENAPTLKQIAPQIMQMINGADLGGFNSNRFDIPMLTEELLRVGVEIDLSKIKLVDVQVIFHKKEPRNLSAAYKFYCNKDLENAHSAEADTNATLEILLAQVEKYQDIPDTIAGLSEISYHNNKLADFAGFLSFDEQGREIFNFGKYKGILVEEIFEKDPGYFAWILNNDFPLYTKKILTSIKLKKLNTKL